MGIFIQKGTTPLFCPAQAEWSSPPAQAQETPATEAEFVICDQTIEEMFGDLKKHGFDLESTHLRHFLRLSRLTLAVCLLYTWSVSFGSQMIKNGKRYLVDRRDRKDLSVFRIGHNAIDRCLTNGLPFSIRLIPHF